MSVGMMIVIGITQTVDVLLTVCTKKYKHAKKSVL